MDSPSLCEFMDDVLHRNESVSSWMKRVHGSERERPQTHFAALPVSPAPSAPPASAAGSARKQRMPPPTQQGVPLLTPDESASLQSLTIPDLKALCAKYSLKVGGNKGALLARLM